jgi:hypothetical protein
MATSKNERRRNEERVKVEEALVIVRFDKGVKRFVDWAPRAPGG